MKNDWLWDRRIGIQEAKGILKNPEDRRFIIMASLLLSRKAEPKEVFTYIEPLIFCKNWHAIKKNMRKDTWAEPRIVFWQAIYEKLLEKYRTKGVTFRVSNNHVKDELCKRVGENIRMLRKEKLLSQKKLARMLHISQQVISRIEQGKENISLVTLHKIANALFRKPEVSFI